ncbi:MAG: D-alanyl-D-alanine carboxypeptidase family protein [Pseudomonadota bacterium]
MTISVAFQSARVALVCLFFSSSVFAADILKPLPAAPKLSAKAYVLMEFESGRLLVAHKETEQLEPASLTKVMTHYIVSDEIDKGLLSRDLDVTVSEKAWRMGGSKMFIEVGKSVSVGDLIKGMVIQSGNDASVQLAEVVAGSEETFADLMNQYAAHLGMPDTSFRNATGMPNTEHVTSARDLAMLSRALIRDFPDSYKLHSEREFEFNDIRQKNRNELLWRDESVDGLKTGHTDASGYGLIASAERDGMRLISVILGADSAQSRLSETAKLLNYGFRFFETLRLFKAEEAMDELRIWKGAARTVPVGVLEELTVAIPRGHGEQLESNLELRRGLQAPVSKGDEVGVLVVLSNGEVLLEQPVVALDDVAEGGLFEIARDSILQMLE